LLRIPRRQQEPKPGRRHSSLYSTQYTRTVCNALYISARRPPPREEGWSSRDEPSAEEASSVISSSSLVSPSARAPLLLDGRAGLSHLFPNSKLLAWTHDTGGMNEHLAWLCFSSSIRNVSYMLVTTDFGYTFLEGKLDTAHCEIGVGSSRYSLADLHNAVHRGIRIKHHAYLLRIVSALCRRDEKVKCNDSSRIEVSDIPTLPLSSPCSSMLQPSSARPRQHRQSARLAVHHSPRQAHNTQDTDTHKMENPSAIQWTLALIDSCIALTSCILPNLRNVQAYVCARTCPGVWRVIPGRVPRPIQPISEPTTVRESVGQALTPAAVQHM
jgi:hypothetical protein